MHGDAGLVPGRLGVPQDCRRGVLHPPSPSSRRFNTDGEGASAKLHLQRPDGVEVLLEPVHHALESEEPPRTEWFSAMLLKRVTPPG